MSSPHSDFTHALVANHRWQGKSVTEQFTEHNALYRMMKEKGNVKVEATGGEFITYPLDYTPNPTIMNYAEMQRFNVSRHDFLTNVKFDWKNKVGVIVASGQELRLNQGETALVKLTKAKRKNFINAVANHMAVELYADGSTEGAITGLASKITAAGTGTVGGINSTTHTWWKNKIQTESGNADASESWLTPDYLKRDMNKLKIKCTIGTQSPDAWVLTNDLYETYMASLQAQQRFMEVKKARAGFDVLAFHDSSPVIHDLNASGGFTGEMGYALNLEYFYLLEHPDAKWGAESERVPYDQDAVMVPYFWMGEAVITSRRHQGRLVAAA